MQLKHIKLEDYTDEEQSQLSDLVSGALIIYEYDDIEYEFSVEDLKVDTDGVIYAPTEVTHTVETGTPGFTPPDFVEVFSELRNYRPIIDILWDK